MSLDMTFTVIYQVLKFLALMSAVIGFCGALLLMGSADNLKKMNSIFNKTVFSLGTPNEKMDKIVLDIDSWVMKRQRAVGVVVLIASIAIFINQYIHII